MRNHMKRPISLSRLIPCLIMLLCINAEYAGSQKKASAVIQANVVPRQIRILGHPAINSLTPRTPENTGSLPPRFPQSATGGDLIVTAGTQMTVAPGTEISLGGN